MFLKNSSTHIIIQCFAWKYHFIIYKIFSSTNAFEDHLRKRNALFRIVSIFKKKIDRKQKEISLKTEIKCLSKCKIQHKMDMIIIATHCMKF